MNLAIKINRQRWVSYPRDVAFPRQFKEVYPFRGRGVVSRALFFLHESKLDRIFLCKDAPPLPFDDVAWFWPSSKRSVNRFYGYRLNDGYVRGYIKVAIGGEEGHRLEREVDNVRTIASKAPKTFKVPKCIACRAMGEYLLAEFEPLPEDSHDIPDSNDVLGKVCVAREEIASFGYSHGDFLSHNVKLAHDGLWIIDWEEMSQNATRLLDQVSFETAFMFFHRHKSLNEVCDWFAESYLTDAERVKDAIAALKSMASRRVGLGGMMLEHFWKDETLRKLMND